MSKFNVTVLEHRNHTVTVEAADEDEAIEAVQQQIFGKAIDLSKGETTLVEAIEVERAAVLEGERAAVHAEFRAAGFSEEWMGGNCRAWRKAIGAHSLWISDEAAGLGDERDEKYAIVLSERHGDESVGEGEDHDRAVATGTQPEVLALARGAEADPIAFISEHPL